MYANQKQPNIAYKQWTVVAEGIHDWENTSKVWGQ